VGDYFQKVFGQIAEFIKGLSPMKKFALTATSLGILVGMALLFTWAGSTAYVPLMSNLNPEDSANIIRVLRDKHIPFKVDPSGKNIMVPPEEMDQLRLELASQGVVQTSVVGYEVFDKQQLGSTSFVQKINQKRALEGELTRTIGTIKGVKRARVHLAMPQKSTFVEDQKKSTASVALDLEPGIVLAEKQIYGIGNLVARAVEGMDVADVVILDQNGKMLSKNSSDPLAAATASQIDIQRSKEEALEKRLKELLGRVVGEGRVDAKITAELDFSQVNETQTTYDQEGAALRSKEIRNEDMEGKRPGPQGLAGASSNLPGAPPASNGDITNKTIKGNEVSNFAVPQTVRNTIKPTGQIKRLSVAIVIDGKTVKTTGKDGVVTSKVEAWSAEKLKEFEDMAARAVGLDKSRGDTLEIKNMEFTHEDFDEASRFIAEKEHRSYIQNIVMYGVIGVMICLFFLVVVKPFIKWITENTIDSVDTFLPQTIEELERLQKNATLPGLEETVPVLPDKIDPEKVEGEMIKEKIITLVDANPHKAALILKDWLHLKKEVPVDKDGNKLAEA
jgi:flagellar M-ring protein FliF